MLRKLSYIFSGLIVLVILSPLFIYWWGLSNLETLPVPSNMRLTEFQEQEIWDKGKEIGIPNIKEISVYGFISSVVCNVRKGLNAKECLSKYPGLRISAFAIKQQVLKQVRGQRNIVWQVTWMASTIWVTQNWNIHQVLATYHETYNT